MFQVLLAKLNLRSSGESLVKFWSHFFPAKTVKGSSSKAHWKAWQLLFDIVPHIMDLVLPKKANKKCS